MHIPEILYKVVSEELWMNSQGKHYLELSDADQRFIHFSTKEQYPRIAEKFAAREEHYAILEINTTELIGDMKLETAPGSTEGYFHLYKGRIPMTSMLRINVPDDNLSLSSSSFF